MDDLIDGIWRLFHSDCVDPVNIGNPAELTVLQLADLVLELTGSSSTLEFGPLPEGDPKVRQPDIALARQVLGWQPEIDLREGLRKTIDYFGLRLKAGAGPATRKAQR